MRHTLLMTVPLLLAACSSSASSDVAGSTQSAATTVTTAATTTTPATTTTAAPTTTQVPTIPADAPIKPASLAFTLPTGFEYPEGIAVDPDTGRVYVTSTPSGAIAVAEPGANSASVWLAAGSDGRSLTLGIEFDVDRQSVWVVSPPSIFEYGTDGTLRGRHSAPASGFLNDLAVTADGIYVTDSSVPQLWFLPRGSAADAPLQLGVDLVGISPEFADGLGLNGIEALPDGNLVAGHFANGKLFLINPHVPNRVDVIDLGGYLLTVSDGMRRQGNTLWVTRGAAGDSLDRVALCPTYTCGTVVAGSIDPGLSFPTDVEIRGDELLVVNSQFDNGGGLGNGVATKPFAVSTISITYP